MRGVAPHTHPATYVGGWKAIFPANCPWRGWLKWRAAWPQWVAIMPRLKGSAGLWKTEWDSVGESAAERSGRRVERQRDRGWSLAASSLWKPDPAEFNERLERRGGGVGEVSVDAAFKGRSRDI